MANPIYNLMTKQQKPQVDPRVAQYVKMYKSAANPAALIQNNPQLQSILSMYNGDLQSAFYGLCQQCGANPDEVLSIFK